MSLLRVRSVRGPGKLFEKQRPAIRSQHSVGLMAECSHNIGDKYFWFKKIRISYSESRVCKEMLCNLMILKNWPRGGCT